MTELCPTPAGAVLVAIDMSKNRQVVLIERPEGDRRRRMTVMATKEDYDGFAEQLVAIGRPIVVGFEATGNYLWRDNLGEKRVNQDITDCCGATGMAGLFVAGKI